MKRAKLIKTITAIGCVFVRHGGKHDWYRNPTTGISQPVPRHREIKEHLANPGSRCLPPTALRAAIVWALLPCCTALAQDASPAAAAVVLDPARFGLEEVQDRTELRFEDRAAYFGILDHVRRVDPEALRRAAAEFVAQRHQVADERLRRFPLEEFPVFADLFLHPEAYRGRPVALSGHVIRVQKYSAANEFGLDPLYEAWLVADDSNHNPAAVIFTECPPELAVGEELVDGVSVVGYFLKLQIHEARDGKVHIAPLILARTLTVTPAGPPAELLPRPAKIAGGIVLLALAATLALWLASGRRRPHELRAEIGETSRPDFRALEKLDHEEGRGTRDEG